MGGRKVGFITCASLLFIMGNPGMGNPGQVPGAHPIPHITVLGLAALLVLESVLLADRPPWWIDQTMNLLFRRLAHPEALPRLAPPADTFDENDVRIMREIWSRAKAEPSLPEIPTLTVAPPAVEDVEPNPPS